MFCLLIKKVVEFHQNCHCQAWHQLKWGLKSHYTCNLLENIFRLKSLLSLSNKENIFGCWKEMNIDDGKDVAKKVHRLIPSCRSFIRLYIHIVYLLNEKKMRLLSDVLILTWTKWKTYQFPFLSRKYSK